MLSQVVAAAVLLLLRRFRSSQKNLRGGPAAQLPRACDSSPLPAHATSRIAQRRRRCFIIASARSAQVTGPAR